MSRNILFILEGSRAEPRFLRKIITLTRTNDGYEFFSYNTNLHRMLSGMFVGDDIDDDLDFLEYLKSCKTNKDDAGVLDRKFSDIFLIFDMDPHDQNYDPDRVAKALSYFDDSTDNGKLYVNYPMLESFKHIPCLDDLSYLDVVVHRDDVRRYKELVGIEGSKLLSDTAKMDEQMLMRIIVLNLIKANKILDYGTDMPDMEHYHNNMSHVEIFEHQCESLDRDGVLPVLNTCVFNVIDYNPRKFFERTHMFQS